MHKDKKIYFAAPLFSSAERAFNTEVVAYLEREFSLFLPQRDGDLVAQLVAEGNTLCSAKASVFARDINAIRESSALVAVLDGRAIDEGVAFEMGVAFERSIPCFGLQSDPRRSLFNENNPMIDCALISNSKNKEDLLRQILRFFA